MLPHFASTQKPWKLLKSNFTPDPNINAGSEILIPEADSASQQTVPRLKRPFTLPLEGVLSKFRVTHLIVADSATD